MEDSNNKSSDNNGQINILIVDDDKILRGLLKEMIASIGYSFSLAADGVEATQELKKQQFNIILSDIHMPKMDGMELLKYAQENHPDTGVILVTGYSEKYSYVDVIDAGAIDFMTKPFEAGELKAKLQRVLREQTLINELKQKTIRDPLTNLFNRRHFDTKMAEELYRAARQDYSVFLAFVDVDNFKKYNDTFGHQEGDQLLILASNIMTSCARTGVDNVFRIGGDEFAIVIPQINLEQAVKICERIRSTFLKDKVGGTTLSFGITKFQQDKEIEWEENVKEFIKKTDKTLYKAKNSGRNKIVTG